MYVRVLPIALVVGVVLCLSAGRLVPAFMAYAGGIWLVTGTIYTVLLRVSPELVAERMGPPSDRDRISRRLAIPLVLGHYVVAGLDARLGWSEMPAVLQVLGFVLVCGALALTGWTLWSNPFASTAVRVQDERAHTVVDTGPYAIVRHPMYLGVLLFGLGSPLALGGWVSALPLLPVLAVFVRRTRFEDRMLHEELPGYAVYAARVRSRVIPGVW